MNGGCSANFQIGRVLDGVLIFTEAYSTIVKTVTISPDFNSVATFDAYIAQYGSTSILQLRPSGFAPGVYTLIFGTDPAPTLTISAVNTPTADANGLVQIIGPNGELAYLVRRDADVVAVFGVPFDVYQAVKNQLFEEPIPIVWKFATVN